MVARERWAKLYESETGVPLVWFLTVALLGAAVYPLAVAGYYTNAGAQHDADWVRHLFLRKEAALALAPPGPRVLIIGGSGCLFSLDAGVLERELHQPVINLCTHAGVGVEYMLSRARRHARQGDTVLLAIENRVLNLPEPSESTLEWDYFTSWDRRHYLEHGALGAYRLIYRIPFAGIWKSRENWRKLQDGYKEDIKYSYDVMAMTPNGDLHESFGHRDPLLGRLEVNFLMPSESSRQRVAAFADWAKSNGVHVRAAYQAAALDPKDFWRTMPFFQQIPAWWHALGIETLGTPERAVWPTAYFMDTIHHSGPAVSYQNALRVAAAMRPAGEKPESGILLLPPHPERRLLPFPAREQSSVEIYGGDAAANENLRTELRQGRRVVAVTAALGQTLAAAGFRVKPVQVTETTPTQVLEANRNRIIAMCVRPDAPAALHLDTIQGGQAWAGVWQDGRWTLEHGPATASLTAAPSANLATGAAQAYRLQIQATAAACEIQFFERDRYPSPAPVRMVVIDPQRGISIGLYDFGPDLRTVTRWMGEVHLP